MSYFTRFAHLLKGDPDQPRDERGRWTLTGTGEPGGVLVSEEAREQIARMDVAAFARITGASPVELTEKFQRGTGLDLRIDSVGYWGAEPFVDWKIIKDGREIGEMRRQWSPDGAIVFHDNIEIVPEWRGVGLGPALTGNMFAHYRQSGVEEVRLHAAREQGGYVWARAGFKPTPGEALALRHGLQFVLDRKIANASLRAKAQPLIDGLASDPRNLWKIADLPDKVVWGGEEMSLGKALLVNMQWHGRIRLDDREAMARLDAWVKSRTLRKAESAAAPTARPRRSLRPWQAHALGRGAEPARIHPMAAPA